MEKSSLFEIKQADRHRFCENIINSSSPNPDFYFLVVLSTTIVALGLLADNAILVIGGMLVTPILSAILAIALGVIINDYKVTFRSVKIFMTSLVLALAVSILVGWFGSVEVENIHLISIMKPSLYTLIVAIVAGLAASFIWVKPCLNQALPGIAVTVTLVPPLTAIGLTIADAEWLIFRDVLNVFLLNIAGILLASTFVFTLTNFYKAKRKLIAEVKEEETEKIKEKKKAEKIKLKKSKQ